MDKTYPILHVKCGIIPEMLQTTVSDLTLGLIAADQVSNFAIGHIGDVDHLQRRFHWLESDCEAHEPFGTIEDRVNYLVGYNQNHLPLMISNHYTDARGTVQILGQQLIFLSQGIPLQHHRDSYLFGFSNDKYYTAVDFFDIVKEFFEKGYKLVVNDVLAMINKLDASIKLREPTARDLAKLKLS